MCQVIPILFLFFFFNLTKLGKLHLSSNPHKVPKGFSSPIAALGLKVSNAVCTTRSLSWEFYLQELCMSENFYYSNLYGKNFDSGDGSFAGLIDSTIPSSLAALPEHLSVCSPQEENFTFA